MDIGPSVEKNFSSSFQSGPLSFEFFFKDKKVITNSGYFQNYQHQLNQISKSTAAHSTLIIDNSSASSFKKNQLGLNIVNKGYKITNKKIVYEKNFWSIRGLHDGYLSNYGVMHERTLEFYPEINKIIGKDKLIKKKNFKSANFDIRFHLMPETKITKLQDEKTVLVELENSGWRFFSNDGSIGIETGLYFGKKNNFKENQNIFINGSMNSDDQLIEWELNKV